MLLTDPDTMRRLREDRAAVPRFVEEVLRLNGSVQFRPRLVTADTELAGTPLKKGDMVVAFLLAANRDPGHYECPHAVDLDRKVPTDHIAFNYGNRICLGAALARAELRTAITQALDKFPHLELDPDAEPPMFRGLLHRSYRPLHVRVDGSAENS
jgi:cytochrome P450